MSFYSILISLWIACASLVYVVPYLIEQRPSADGGVEIYSPYFLWIDQLYDSYPPGGEALSQPFKVFSVSGMLDITLTVEPYTWSTPLFELRTRAFCFNDICNVPGPTFICKPGDIIRINLVNKLQKDSTGSNSTVFPDELFFPNRTNVFFPSLPFDSSLNSPYVYTEGDGDSIVYQFQIPSTQPPGLHWYQSRVHGVSALQVMGGLFGGLIIQQTTTHFNPSAFSNLPRELLVFHHIMVDRPVTSPLANIPNESFSLIDEDFESSSLSLTYLAKAYGSKLPLQVSYYTNTATSQVRDAWLTNNQFMPFVSFSTATWAAFDIIVASTDRILQLEIRSQIGYNQGSSNGCEMRVLGRNGYYYQSTRTKETLVLLQGDRATIAVTCTTAGTYYLQSVATFNASESSSRIGDYTTQTNQVLLVLQISGTITNSTNITTVIANTAPPVDQSTFLDTYTPISLSTKDINIQSISTAQNSLAYRQSIAQNSSISSCEKVEKSQFQVGTGTHCVLPCYDPILCGALFGDDMYSVDQYPVSLNGECSFEGGSVTAGHICQQNYSSSMQASNNLLENWTVTSANNMTILKLNLFGTSSENSYFSFPITLQSRLFTSTSPLQFSSYNVPNNLIANILQRDEYIPSYEDYNSGLEFSSLFGIEEGDVSETWPTLPGQTTLLVQLPVIENQVVEEEVLILTPYLKFADRGFLRKIQLSTSSSNASTINTVNNTGSISNNNSTLMTEKAQTAAALYAYDIEPDSTPNPFLCSINGSSFLYHETLNFTTKQRVLTTNSCPNHFSLCQSAECGGPAKTRAVFNPQTYSIPMYPVFATSPRDTTCVIEMPLGVALNGVGIYGPSDGSQWCVPFSSSNGTKTSAFGRTNCIATNRGAGLLSCGDNLPFIVNQLDKCGGYTPRRGDITYPGRGLPPTNGTIIGGSGFYQYKTLPRCLLTQLSNAQTSQTVTIYRRHSVQLGWALDGFPIYGPRGAKGIIMQPCNTPGAHPQLCLDSCNGYKGKLPGVDEFLYRYYLTSADRNDLGLNNQNNMNNQLLSSPTCSSTITSSSNTNSNTSTSSISCDRLTNKCCMSTLPPKYLFPYSIGCYRGCLADDPQCYAASTERGFTSDYLPNIARGVAGVDVASYENTPFSPYSMLASSPEMTGDIQSSITSFNSSSSTTNTTTVNVNVTEAWQDLRIDRSILTRTSPAASLSLLTVDASILSSSSSVAGGYVQEKEVLSPQNLMHSLSLDQTNQRLYIATETTIAVVSLTDQEPQLTTLVSNPLVVDIAGVNLGLLRDDLLSITINQTPCTSILHISSILVQCMMSISDPLRTYSIDDIELRTVSGIARGLNLDAISVQNSRSNRPALTQAMFTPLSCRPRALFLLPNSSYGNTTETETTIAYQGTIYFTSVVDISTTSGIYPSLYRSMADGSNLEIILTSTSQRNYGLVVFEQYLDSSTLLVKSDQQIAENEFEQQSALCQSTLNDGDMVVTDGGYASFILNNGYNIPSSSTNAASNTIANHGIYSSGTDNSKRQIFAQKCSILFGHVIFIADSESFGSLYRLSLLPSAVETVIFSPPPAIGAGSTGVLWLQDTSEPIGEHVLPLMTIMRGVMGASSLFLDLSSISGSTLIQPSLWMTLQEGVLLQLDLQTILLASNNFNSSESSSSVGLQLLSSTQEQLPIDSNGMIIFHPIANSSSTGMTWPYQLNTLDLIFNYTNTIKTLPRWIKTAAPLGNVDTRWTSVVVVPIEDLLKYNNLNQTDDMLLISRADIHQRIILLDVAQQQLMVSDTQTLRTATINLGQKFSIFLPLAMQYQGFNVDTNTVEILVMETLGRIWLITLPLTTVSETTMIDTYALRFALETVSAPSLLVDKSSFTTAAKLSYMLSEARDAGKPSSSAFFFESNH